MKKLESSRDEQEINKFAQFEQDWWDKEGPLKTLHDINDTRLAFIAQHAIIKGSHILDVGCGGGILCEALAQAGAIVAGIDAEPQAIASATAHARLNNLPITYYHSTLEEFESSQFDIITCMEMLEHVPNPEFVLKHCKRLLKPQGLLFVSTISRTVKSYLNAIIAAEYVLQLVPRQTHEYSKFIKPSELLAITRALGLELIDMKGMHYNPVLRTASLGTDVSVNYLVVLS